MRLHMRLKLTSELFFPVSQNNVECCEAGLVFLTALCPFLTKWRLCERRCGEKRETVCVCVLVWGKEVRPVTSMAHKTESTRKTPPEHTVYVTLKQNIHKVEFRQRVQKLTWSRFRELAWWATISHVTAHSSSVTAGSNISPFPAVAPAQWLCDSEVKVRLFLPRLWEQKPAYFLVPVLDSTEMGHIVLTLNKKQKCLICLLQEINTCSWKRRLEPTERAYLSRLMSCSSGSASGPLLH